MGDRLLRLGYRAAAAGLVVWHQVRRPTIHGVRCALLRGDEVLLVRHTYGDRSWSLPGGRSRRNEPPEQTARREMLEELGLDIGDWRAFTTRRFVGGDRAKHVVTGLVARCPGEPRPRAAEIAALRWFPADRLPPGGIELLDEFVAGALGAFRA